MTHGGRYVIVAYGGGNAHGVLAPATVAIYGAGTARPILPTVGVYARASLPTTHQTQLVSPALRCTAYSGATFAGTLPTVQFAGTATFPNIGRVQAALPALQLASHARVGGVAGAALTLSSGLILRANGGGNSFLALAAGGYSVSASGKTGGVARAELQYAGTYLLRASGDTQNTGTARMQLPALQMAPTGHAWLVGPSLTAYAVAGEVVATTYEAYAINLTTGAVTRYINYPFDNIVRLGDAFFGITATGIYRIGGDLDALAPIAAEFETFPTDFREKNFKRIPYAYLSGRAENGITLSVCADEGESFAYESDFGETGTATNHRVTVGKGIRGVYYSLRVANADGGSMEIDELSVQVGSTQRGV